MTVDASTPSGGDAALAQRADAAGAAAIGHLDAARCAAAREGLDRVALAAMAATLRDAGLFAGETAHTADEIAATLRAARRHHWLVQRWLDALVTEGFLGRGQADGRYRHARSPATPGAETLAEACAGLGYPGALARFFRSANEQLPALVRDDVLVQELLFPSGDLATAETAYRDNLVNRYLNAATREVLCWAASGRPASVGALRVLELGAGVGGTTADIAPSLTGVPVDYLFTDVSTFFLSAARERFAAYPWMRFGLLDMNADLGGHPGAALVLAANVLHNAHHVGHTLRQLRDLLEPGGLLVLVESCREHYQLLTSMHFLMSPRAGQPQPGQADLRAGTNRVFLDAAEWRAQLREAHLAPVLTLPGPQHPLAVLAQHVLVARKPGAPTRAVG